MSHCFLSSAHPNRGAGGKAAPTEEKFHGVTELLRQSDGAIELRLKERYLGQRKENKHRARSRKRPVAGQ